VCTLGLFEDQASLIAAVPIAEHWMVDYRRRTGTRADRSWLTAEVVGKKGLW
jgi:hypothetical protein